MLMGSSHNGNGKSATALHKMEYLEDCLEHACEALQRAVEMARVEAEVIASAAGERLGPPLSIHSGGVARPVSGPMYDMRAMAVEAMAAPTPVEGGTLTVMASVTIVYRLESQ